MSRLGFEMVSDEDAPPRRRSRAALVVVVVGVVLVMLAGLVALRTVFRSGDYEGEGTGEVTVTVAKGETLREIAESLVAADVVRTQEAFLRAAESDDRSGSIGPGAYSLRKQMSGAAALDLMLDPRSRSGARLAVPEGLTVAETVALTAKTTPITAKAMRAALAKPATYGLPDMADGDPEGYLFPATYDVEEGTTATALLSAMTRRFEKAARDTDLVPRAADLGRKPEEIVTIASILQREVRPEDYAKVSRVIENRLAKGMRLQLDSTVAYALGLRELKLTAAQLRTRSPYNTYRVSGLPPGPVCNPGQAALEAALAPAEGDWLYFVTTDPKTGETKFTSSYEEFLAFKAEFLANTAGNG